MTLHIHRNDCLDRIKYLGSLSLEIEFSVNFDPGKSRIACHIEVIEGIQSLYHLAERLTVKMQLVINP
jgi:hypothetical protein